MGRRWASAFTQHPNARLGVQDTAGRLGEWNVGKTIDWATSSTRCRVMVCQHSSNANRRNRLQRKVESTPTQHHWDPRKTQRTTATTGRNAAPFARHSNPRLGASVLQSATQSTIPTRAVATKSANTTSTRLAPPLSPQPRSLPILLKHPTHHRRHHYRVVVARNAPFSFLTRCFVVPFVRSLSHPSTSFVVRRSPFLVPRSSFGALFAVVRSFSSLSSFVVVVVVVRSFVVIVGTKRRQKSWLHPSTLSYIVV